MIIPKPPEYIRHVMLRLTENGYDAFLVGGCVRDSIMGRAVHDWDVASSAAPDEVARLFPVTALTGKKYGTVTVVLPDGTAEVTTFRVESGYNDGRRPDNVVFVKNLNEDLSRRDFTMNAIAVSIDGKLTDPFGGFKDINKRMIRCVGDPHTRFSEDALRMFRAFRFSAELGFTIERKTLESICANTDKAWTVSAERVRTELEKTLLSQYPEKAGEMAAAGLLAKYIDAPVDDPGNRLRRITALPAEAALRWCAYCAVLIDTESIAAPGDFLRAMRLDANTIKTCKSALSLVANPIDSTAKAETRHDPVTRSLYDPCKTDCSRIGIKRLLAKHGTDAARCAAAARDTIYGGSALAITDEIINSGECFSLGALAVSGSDLTALGRPPGRGIGLTLARLLDHVITRPEDNEREILLKIIEEPAEQ